jgi:hypothetical protein
MQGFGPDAPFAGNRLGAGGQGIVAFVLFPDGGIEDVVNVAVRDAGADREPWGRRMATYAAIVDASIAEWAA